MDIFTYDAEDENFASEDSSSLDTWVFHKVSRYIEHSFGPVL